MLEIRGLVVGYGPIVALHGVDVHVDKGEIVGVIGPNGAGKSSLVGAIAGLVPVRQGEIRFAGAPVNGPPHQRMMLGISVVPEGRGLFPRMSVEENLRMGGYNLPDEARWQLNVERCYALFPVLAERHRQLAGTLSGGQQQMLALSMGLMANPEILILDEPSLGLAPIVIGEIGACLKAMKTAGTTVLLVEQNATLTGDVADRIYVLQNGLVRFHDDPGNLFKNPEVAESFLSMG